MSIEDLLYSHATSVSWSFLVGDVVATIAMGVGIKMEEPDNPTRRQRIAGRLVIGAVIAETLCSVCLFAFDGAVSNRQQDKIIALEERLAARTIWGPDISAMADSLKPYAGQRYEINSYEDDRESADLAADLDMVLVGARWSAYKPSGKIGIVGVVAGVVVYADEGASPATKGAAIALVRALNNDRINIIATYRESSNFPATELVNVTVGIKP